VRARLENFSVELLRLRVVAVRARVVGLLIERAWIGAATAAATATAAAVLRERVHVDDRDGPGVAAHRRRRVIDERAQLGLERMLPRETEELLELAARARRIARSRERVDEHRARAPEVAFALRRVAEPLDHLRRRRRRRLREIERREHVLR